MINDSLPLRCHGWPLHRCSTVVAPRLLWLRSRWRAVGWRSWCPAERCWSGTRGCPTRTGPTKGRTGAWRLGAEVITQFIRCSSDVHHGDFDAFWCFLMLFDAFWCLMDGELNELMVVVDCFMVNGLPIDGTGCWWLIVIDQWWWMLGTKLYEWYVHMVACRFAFYP